MNDSGEWLEESYFFTGLSVSLYIQAAFLDALKGLGVHDKLDWYAENLNLREQIA